MIASKQAVAPAKAAPTERRDSNGKVQGVGNRRESKGDAVPADGTKRKDSIPVPGGAAFERRRSSFSTDTPLPENMGRRGSVDIFEGKPNLGRRGSINPLAPKLEAPTIGMEEHPQGDRIKLECKITSNTKPEVTWLHLDVKLREGGRYHMELKNTGADQWLSNLYVSEITRKDAGKYSVSAKNESGTNAATVFSFVED